MIFSNIIKRITAILTVAVMMAGSIVFCYAYSYDTVKIKSQSYYKLNYGNTAKFSSKTGTYTKNGETTNAKVYTVEASPKTTSVVASSGAYHYGAETLSDIISKTDIGNKRVAAAINADFFDMWVTGLPFGVQITNGRIVATNNAKYDKEEERVSVGFKADGSTVFGTPEFDMSLTVDDFNIKIDKINQRNNYTNYVLLFNSDYESKTYWGTNQSGGTYDVMVLKTNKALTISDKIDCKFDSFLPNLTSPVDIEKGKLYICAPSGFFSGFDKNSTKTSYVTIKEKTGRWKNVINAVGGGNFLVNHGQMRYPSTFDDDIKNVKTSRSAFGVKADGTYVFYTAEHNKNAGTTGVWMEAVAQAMYNMGCVYAINLDGGGSTTIAADVGDGIKIKNKCQDGSQRKVANALLLVTDELPSVVVEDFESERKLTEVYSGTNLVTASLDNNNAFTGESALKLKYSLSGKGNSVAVKFDPINVSKYKYLSIATNGVGVTISARLKNKNKEFLRPITSGADKGYVRSQINVSDATSLVGFVLTYNKKNTGTVLIDRIVGLTTDLRGDVTAPQMTVAANAKKLAVGATEPPFAAGVDKKSIEITVDREKPLQTNVISTGAYSNDRIHKAKITVTDILGNRALAYQLFKSPTYNSPLPFADMNDSKWDALAIRYCYENGIVNGIKENGVYYYKGNKNITRTEFCVMAVNNKKLDVNKYVGVKLPYKDAGSIPKWALLYVKAAYAEGLMIGSQTAEGLVFSPNSEITRQEAAAVVDRLINIDTRLNSVKKYADEADISNWAKSHVESVTRHGLFGGDDQGRFLPKKSLSRSESAVVMSKL